MKHNWKTHVAVVGLALVPVVAWSALAPAPFSTGPTPISSLPFTITDSGTYCLTGNLTGGPGAAGILVQAPDVVIDLGGFVLAGGVDSDGSGILATPRNVTVRNGTVTGWGRWGLELSNDCVVRDVHVQATDFGAISAGQRFLIERSIVRTTSGVGIQCSSGRIDRCQVEVTESEGSASDAVVAFLQGHIVETRTEGGGRAIVGGPRSRIEGCTAQGFLISGVDAGPDSIVKDCNVNSFVADDGPGTSRGITAAENVTVERCHVSGTVDEGIVAERGSRVVDCTVSDTRQGGIVVGVDASVVGCRVEGANTSGSDGAGIVGGSGTRVESCTVRDAEGPGIHLAHPAGRVEHCDVRGCTGDGILAFSDVLIRGNHTFENDQAGIRILGDRCVLLENVVDRNNDRGIVVDGRTSHLERNLASFNKGGDYDLEWGNPFGKIERPSGQMTSYESQTNYKTPFGF